MTILLRFLLLRKLGKKQQKLESWRQKFLSGLQSAGLEMEDVKKYKLLEILCTVYIRSI